MSSRKVLILGLGNDLISDDGFGPAVAARCRMLLGERSDVIIQDASVAGFHLLDLLSGFDRALIVDVVQTGTLPPGTLRALPIESASAARTLGGSHQMDLATTLALGRALGQNLPSRIDLMVVEAKDLLTVREGLTCEVKAAVPSAAGWAVRWVEDGVLPAPSEGEDCMALSETCPDCNGNGWIEMGCAKPDEARVCSLCNGRGLDTVGRQCQGCIGTGRIEVRVVEKRKCHKCLGTGRSPRPEGI
jgi:hydrogenase maturation protease